MVPACVVQTHERLECKRTGREPTAGQCRGDADDLNKAAILPGGSIVIHKQEGVVIWWFVGQRTRAVTTSGLANAPLTADPGLLHSLQRPVNKHVAVHGYALRSSCLLLACGSVCSRA